MTNWTDIDLPGDPRMLLGRRTSSKRLDLQHVEVDQNLFEDLRTIARSALEQLDRRDAKPYSEFGHATSDDYFETDVSDLPMRRDRRKRDDDPAALQPASALNMTTDADGFPSLDAEELRDFEASLYALAFEDGDGGYTCFVRKQSPRRPLKPGLRFLQFGDTLRKVEPPDLAIDEGIDLVLTTGRCAILNVAAFESIFGDVRVAFGNLPANMTAIERALGDVVPLGETSLEALQERCARRITDAKRLHRLVEEKGDAIASLSSVDLQALLDRHDLEVLDDGELALDDASAGALLDLLDGRFFNDDITGAARRADAFSPR